MLYNICKLFLKVGVYMGKIERKATARYKVTQALKNYSDIKQKIEIIKDNIKLLKEEMERISKGEVSIMTQSVIKYDINKIIDKIRMSVIEKEVFAADTTKPADIKYLKELLDQEEYKLKKNKEIISVINKALKTLTNRQKFIINMYYIDKTVYKGEEYLDNYNKKFKTDIVRIDTIRMIKYETMNKLEKQLGVNYNIMLTF